VPLLPTPPRADRDGVVAWVRDHLGHLACDEVAPSPVRGGQAAADAALAALDLTGYATRRSAVLPEGSRGATRLSPYIRHGLLPLPAVWAAAADAPAADKRKFRDELLWQEYARHLYARLGRANAEPLRFGPPVGTGPWEGQPWPERMACMAATTRELYDEGWLVNQARMWLSSQYAVRAGLDWRQGAEEMYRHLLDGSPAANRLGWQWTVGTATGKVYGFSRWQVEKRAPGLCRGCPLRDACPVQDWPEASAGPRVPPPAGLAGGVTDAGPGAPQVTGAPEAVWLTAESLGRADPALAAHPDLPAVFVFDEPLLARLRLSGKRLVFLAEALAELGAEVRLGDPREELAGRPLAATWTYVPGWKRRAARLDVVALHPWPWLRRPGSGSLRSYSAWTRAAAR
jgi:deoxyribodipyrimidine photo-lyase